MFSDFLTRFSPVHPETGTNGTSSILYPTDFTSCSPFCFALLKASSENLLSSIQL